MTEFHKIRIEESLGKGGSGLVFKGEFLDPALVQLHSTQYVALKKVQGFFPSFFLFSFLFFSFFLKSLTIFLKKKCPHLVLKRTLIYFSKNYQ